MQKKWKKSVKNRLYAGGGIEKQMRNGRLLEVGEEWLGEEETLRMINSYVKDTVCREASGYRRDSLFLKHRAGQMFKLIHKTTSHRKCEMISDSLLKIQVNLREIIAGYTSLGISQVPNCFINGNK